MRHALFIPLFALAAACSETSQPEGGLPPQETGDDAVATRPADQPQYVTVEGRIMDGVECPILETPDGEVWSLSLGEADFGPGDYVRYTGEVADASFCMQGEGTLIAGRIVAIDPPAREHDPARAGGIELTTEHVTGSWAKKGLGGDCADPDFRITASSRTVVLRGDISGHDDSARVDLVEYPRIDLDEPRDDLPIEPRGPDGLAILRPATDKEYDPITIGNATIEGDGVVFVKCSDG